MRLPMDPAAWGTEIMRCLINQLPGLEPYIQLVQILEQDPEGNAHGVIPLVNGNAFIPFVVREFDLKPLDTLIVADNGEDKFRNLNEANAILAMGGLGTGSPVTSPLIGVPRDQELNMLPPRAALFGRRLPPYGVLQSISPVKLAAKLDVSAFEHLFKVAGTIDDELPVYLCRQYQDLCLDLATRKKASTVIVFDPGNHGVDCIVNGEKRGRVTLQEAAEALRAVDPAANEKIARLMRNQPIVNDLRKEATPYEWDPEPMDKPLSEPGWYHEDQRLVRHFRTRHLDGTPCSMWLTIGMDGHRLGRRISGRPAVIPDAETMAGYYQPAELSPGELCFMLDEDSDEVSVPFRIEHVNPGDRTTLVVRPSIGENQTETLHFGHNRHRYRLGRDEIALPRHGLAVFRLSPGSLGYLGDSGVRIRLFRGGGVFSIQEDRREPVCNLTRGQVVAMFMHRYGLPADVALHQVQQASSHITPEFVVRARDELDRRDEIKEGACKLACLAWDLVKQADDRRHPSSGAAQVDLDPTRSGPNRTQEPVGPSGPNPVTAPGVPGALNPPPPNIPHLKEIADTISGFAAGNFSPDELSELYGGLIETLLDIQDQVGRVLLLARLGKVDFITENKAKRLLDEADRFRNTLLNADMLLKGVMTSL